MNILEDLENLLKYTPLTVAGEQVIRDARAEILRLQGLVAFPGKDPLRIPPHERRNLPVGTRVRVENAYGTVTRYRGIDGVMWDGSPDNFIPHDEANTTVEVFSSPDPS